jgi:hypothetical protein
VAERELDLVAIRHNAEGWAMEPSHPAASLGADALDVIDELRDLRITSARVIKDRDLLITQIAEVRAEVETESQRRHRAVAERDREREIAKAWEARCSEAIEMRDAALIRLERSALARGRLETALCAAIDLAVQGWERAKAILHDLRPQGADLDPIAAAYLRAAEQRITALRAALEHEAVTADVAPGG